MQDKDKEPLQCGGKKKTTNITDVQLYKAKLLFTNDLHHFAVMAAMR